MNVFCRTPNSLSSLVKVLCPCDHQTRHKHTRVHACTHTIVTYLAPRRCTGSPGRRWGKRALLQSTCTSCRLRPARSISWLHNHPSQSMGCCTEPRAQQQQQSSSYSNSGICKTGAAGDGGEERQGAGCGGAAATTGASNKTMYFSTTTSCTLSLRGPRACVFTSSCPRAFVARTLRTLPPTTPAGRC